MCVFKRERESVCGGGDHGLSMWERNCRMFVCLYVCALWLATARNYFKNLNYSCV